MAHYRVKAFRRKSLVLSNLSHVLFSFSVPDDVTEITTVEGQSVQLPCDITPPNLKEQVYLVLWYRQDEGEPIYRYRQNFS